MVGWVVYTLDIKSRQVGTLGYHKTLEREEFNNLLLVSDISMLTQIYSEDL